jgi:erythromycin esterase-like protein
MISRPRCRWHPVNGWSERRNFVAIGIEADWPDARRVDRYVRQPSEDRDAAEALADFKRFPTWIWRNTDVVAFVEWLREHNRALDPDTPGVGVYGLDLYNLRAAMESVLRYLERVDPKAATRVRARYACFDHFGENARGTSTSATRWPWSTRKRRDSTWSSRGRSRTRRRSRT